MRNRASHRALIVGHSAVLGLGIALITSGCVVRTQDFHCALENDPNQNFELRMTPTSLDLDSINYSFVEEQGAKRIYENKTLKQRVTFDLATTRLEQSQKPDWRWTCKRYEPY